MNFKLASNIYSTPWLIEPQAAIACIDLLEQVKAGTYKAEKPNYPQLQLFSSNTNIAFAPTDTWAAQDHPGYEGKSLVIMLVSGPIMKEDYCGAMGTASMKQEIKKINATDSVQQIVFLLNSPGGSVDGTEAFANEIKSSSKETWGVVYGQACSACYWIASACDNVVATSQTDIIGSIGTMMSFIDRTAYMEEMGLVLREYYADASKDKNLAFREARDGKGKLLVQQLLNPINDIFLNAVKANRGDKLNEEETLSGKTFLTNDAIKFGLIDSFSPLDSVINNLLNKNQNVSAMKISISSTFKNILALVGLSSTSETVELKEDSMTKIDAALKELEEVKAQNKTLAEAAAADADKIKGLEGNVTQLTSERDQLKTKNTELTAEVEKLGKLDAGKPTTTNSPKERESVEESNSIDASQMDFQKRLYNQA